MAAPLRALVSRALARRGAMVGAGDTTAYRVLHRDGDGLPAIAVDRFDDVLVLHRYDPQAAVHPIAEALREAIPDARALYVKTQPIQASRLRPDEREALAKPLPEWGEPRSQVIALERRIRYEIRPGDGLSVGLFLDMREPRSWVRTQAAGRRVLNLFAYTCGFGVAASLGGATRVVNLDLSKTYLEWGRRNYALNGLAVSELDFIFGEAGDWLRRFARRGDRFEMVVLDPPSFSVAGGRAYAAEQGYSDLVALAAQCVTERGILLAGMNHARTTLPRFRSLVKAGLEAAGRRGRVIEQWREPSEDFPLAVGQVPYLKVVALELGAA